MTVMRAERRSFLILEISNRNLFKPHSLIAPPLPMKYVFGLDKLALRPGVAGSGWQPVME